MESSYYLSDLCLEPVCAPYSNEPFFYGQSFSAFPPFYTTDRRRPSFSFFNSSTSLLPNIDSFTTDYLHQRPSFSFPSSSTASSSSTVSSSVTSASSSAQEPANAYFESIMPHLPHPPPMVHRSKAALPPVSLPTGPQLTIPPPTLPLPTRPVSNNNNNNNSSSINKGKTPKALKIHKTPKSSKKEKKKQNTQPSTNGQADLPPIDVSSPSANGSNESGSRRPMLLKTDKKRVIWTKKLHGLFLQALEVLGHDAMPRSIWSYMEIPGLTRENVASHLQKYKIKLRRERALEEREEGILAEC